MEERILFEERLWYPIWPFLPLLGFLYLVGFVEALLAPTDRTSWIIVIVGPPIVALICAAFFKFTYHHTVTRVGERTLKLSRDRIVPRESVKEARIVSGAELKGLQRQLRRGADLFNASRNAQLRGLATMPGVKTAMYLCVDPPVKKTGVFVIATRRPEEFLAAVQSGGSGKLAQPVSMLG